MKIRLTAVILSALFAMGFAGRAYASDERGLDDRPNLTVRGEALLKVPADQMHLNIAAVTHAETAALALDQNTALMQKVIQALKKIGLTEDEYQTGQFQIEPVWSQRPRQAPEDWQDQGRVKSFILTTSSPNGQSTICLRISLNPFHQPFSPLAHRSITNLHKSTVDKIRLSCIKICPSLFF